MTTLSEFLQTGRCIEWRTELPNAYTSRKSPVFILDATECYFHFVRTNIFFNNYSYNVYLKTLDSSIRFPSLEVEVHVGLKVSDDKVNVFSATVTRPTDEGATQYCVWSVEESFLQSMKYNFCSGQPLKFVFIFNNRLVVLKLQAETGDKSVQASIAAGTESCLQHLSDDFSELFNGAGHDVLLKCGERSIQAHKTVLCARSSVFAAMLGSDMVEGRTNCVEVKDMDEELFEEFVRYLYSGKVAELSWDNARELYAVADKYAVAGLKKRCAIFLADSLTSENACEYLALADAHSDPDLKKCAISFILDNKIPRLEDQWLPFAREHPVLANEVLYQSYMLH